MNTCEWWEASELKTAARLALCLRAVGTMRTLAQAQALITIAACYTPEHGDVLELIISGFINKVEHGSTRGVWPCTLVPTEPRWPCWGRFGLTQWWSPSGVCSTPENFLCGGYPMNNCVCWTVSEMPAAKRLLLALKNIADL
ncbi:MAG: hypothetical protein KAI73_00325, partial [Rhodospirillaceae bacterium]|nr:hypothetical protein [Rhodospirillaceae bacterium]